MSAPGNSGGLHQTVRWLLCIGSLIVAAITTYKAWEDKALIPPTQRIDAIKYSDPLKAAIDANIDQSKGLFDVGLLLLGALWALVIAKKDEGRIALGDVPEVIMLLSASALLLLSFEWHEFYLENLGAAYELASRNCTDLKAACFPDVLGIPSIEFLRNYQETFLRMGGGIALATIFSAHQLKGVRR
jgi:hypothetical protein